MTIILAPEERDPQKIVDVIRQLSFSVDGLVAAGLGVGYGLAVSAGSSALTISLKNEDGTDPSTTDPAYIAFRDPTGTAGTETKLAITAATSLVISSGSTLGVSSSTAFRIWIVGFNDGGTFRLGAINCSTSSRIHPLIEGIASSTAEGGAGAADSAGVIYTSSAVSSKAMRILGFAEWNSSGLTAGTWTTSNLSLVQLFSPGIKKPGDVVQIVTALPSPNDSTSSTTFIASSATVTLTPSSAANPIYVQSSGICYIVDAGALNNSHYRISRGTTNNTNMIGSESEAFLIVFGTQVATFGCMAFDLPNTASSQSYNVQLRASAGTGTANLGNGAPVLVSAVEYMG